MTKVKYFMMALMIGALMFFVPSFSNAADVSVTRNFYSNNGSVKYNFSGLTLDTTHEYEFGLTSTAAAQVGTWHLITDYTETTAVVDIMTTTSDLRKVINTSDKGYITIKDKTTDTVSLQPYAIDLKMPYLRVSNYTVLKNGKELKINDSEEVQIALRNADVSKAYYQYEKIIDQALINKYKEIKANNGDFIELENMIKTTVPETKWTEWYYWNGYDSSGMSGHGNPQQTIATPDSGLYYMWLYFSGNNIKNVYGCILVDNLEAEIALDSISLPKTSTVEMGKTLTLTPTFNPTTTTNKIVTWSSSDTSVATVDNNGKVTPKKVGATIITVTSQDGKKKASCTVTVTAASTSGNNGQNGNNSKGDTTKKDNTTTGGDTTKKDNTTAGGVIPQTGFGIGLISVIVLLIGGSIVGFIKHNKLKEI